MKQFRGFTLTLALLVFGATQAFGQTIYNNNPSPMPGNLPSIAFAANQGSEFGDRVQFSAGSARNLTTVIQTMSSWACESGHWSTGDCVTAPGATFSHPVTLNIYNVGAGAAVGTLIGTVTQTFAIPYRPSADNVNCTGGRWFDGTACYNGLATPITFNLGGLNVPNEVIYGIAFNTSASGYAPIGTGTACYSTPEGCGYDSLNVATVGTPASVGVNPAPDDAYWAGTYGPYYCDGGAGGTGTFRLDAGCWTGFKPAVTFNAANPAPNKNSCKNGGWQTYTRADGTSFKNQGDCVSYSSNGK